MRIQLWTIIFLAALSAAPTLQAAESLAKRDTWLIFKTAPQTPHWYETALREFTESRLEELERFNLKPFPAKICEKHESMTKVSCILDTARSQNVGAVIIADLDSQILKYTGLS